MKRILSAIIAVVMMLSIAPVANIFFDTDTAITASATSYVRYYRGTCYSTAKYGLEMRKTPSDSAGVFTTVPKGRKLTYLGYKKGSSYWAYVYYPTGDCYGWVHTKYITFKSSSSSSGSYVKSYRGAYRSTARYGLEMRKTPSDSAGVFTTVPKGRTVYYYGYKKGSTYWAYVYYPAGDCYGWVHTKYITPC